MPASTTGIDRAPESADRPGIRLGEQSRIRFVEHPTAGAKALPYPEPSPLTTVPDKPLHSHSPMSKHALAIFLTPSADTQRQHQQHSACPCEKWLMSWAQRVFGRMALSMSCSLMDGVLIRKKDVADVWYIRTPHDGTMEHKSHPFCAGDFVWDGNVVCHIARN
jgi:hypothetical protein